MFGRWRKIQLAILVATILSLGFGGSVALSKGTEYIVFGTASVGGAFYPLGVAMSNVINDTLPGFKASAQVTGGAKANMDLLEAGEIQIGFESGGLGLAASKGLSPYTKEYDIQLLFQFCPTPYQVFTLERTGIKSVYDLKGKRVNVGPVGSGTIKTVEDLLAAHGLAKGSYKALNYGFEQSVEALVDGLLDATVVSAAVPSPALESVQERHKPVLVDIDAQLMQGKIRQDEAFKLFQLITLNAGTYKWQARPVTVLSAMTRAWARADLPEDVVYQVVKTIFENKNKIAEAHPGGRVLMLFTEEDVRSLGVEVHPGAVKYAKEVGAW